MTADGKNVPEKKIRRGKRTRRKQKNSSACKEMYLVQKPLSIYIILYIYSICIYKIYIYTIKVCIYKYILTPLDL